MKKFSVSATVLLFGIFLSGCGQSSSQSSQNSSSFSSIDTVAEQLYEDSCVTDAGYTKGSSGALEELPYALDEIQCNNGDSGLTLSSFYAVDSSDIQSSINYLKGKGYDCFLTGDDWIITSPGASMSMMGPRTSLQGIQGERQAIGMGRIEGPCLQSS